MKRQTKLQAEFKVIVRFLVSITAKLRIYTR